MPLITIPIKVTHISPTSQSVRPLCMEAEYILTSYNRDWTLIVIYDLRCSIKDNCVVNSIHKHWLQYCNIIGMVDKYTFANWIAEITNTEKLEMAWRRPKDSSINQTSENKFWKIDFTCNVTFNNHYSSTCKQHLGAGAFYIRIRWFTHNP